jgi:predicted ester cyclase
MSLEEHKALVRRCFEEAPYNAEVCDEIFAPGIHWHALYHTANADFDSTPEAEKEAYERHKRVWGDWGEHVEEMIAEGDRVMVRWSGVARHQGEYLGLAPTHRRVRLSGISIFRIADGKIAEVWSLWDRLGEWQQLGVLPDVRQAVAEAGEPTGLHKAEEGG